MVIEMPTANELFFIGAGALFGYHLGGLWFALIGGILGYAVLFGADWVIGQSFVPDDSNTFVGPPQE